CRVRRLPVERRGRGDRCPRRRRGAPHRMALAHAAGAGRMSLRTSDAEELPVIRSGPRSTAWWGMALLIAAELALFASLLAGYFYLRFKATEWPLDGLEKPNLVPGAIATVLLLSSSLPMWWAERGIRQGNARRLRIGLLVSFLLGAGFLAIQASEYASASFDWRTNVYGSMFFTIT